MASRMRIFVSVQVFVREFAPIIPAVVIPAAGGR